MPLLVKRILASVIDYAIIGLYATALFAGVTLLASLLHLKLDVGPVLRQLIGFVTLTLPIFL